MNDSQAYKPVVVKGFLVVKFFSLGFHYPKIMCLKKNIHVSNQTIGFHKMFLKFEVIMFTLYLFLYNTQYMKEHAW